MTRALVLPEPVRQQRFPDHTRTLNAEQQARRPAAVNLADLAADLKQPVPVLRAAPEKQRVLRSAGEVRAVVMAFDLNFFYVGSGVDFKRMFFL